MFLIEFTSKVNLRFKVLIIAFTFGLMPAIVNAQNTITFDDQGYMNVADLDNFNITSSGTVFSFSSSSLSPGYEYRTTTNFCYAPPTGWVHATGASITELKFGTQNGSEFDLASFRFVNDFACFGAGQFQTLKVEGFKNGGSTGSTTFSTNANIVTVNLASNTDFDDVDEVKVTLNGGGNINLPGFDDIVWTPAVAPSGTSFSGLGAVNSGSAGFKSITNIPEIVVSNIMDISGTEIFPVDNVSDPVVFVLKADEDDAESFDVTDLQIFGFNGNASSTFGTNYDGSTITFKNAAGGVIATMSGASGFLSNVPQSMDDYFGGDNFPITGVAKIEFSMNSNAHNNFTLSSIAIANVVAPATGELQFTSDGGAAWDDGIAEDGEGGSADLAGLNIQIYNVDASLANIGEMEWYSDGGVGTNNSFSGLTTFFASIGEDDRWKGQIIKESGGKEFQINSFGWYDWGNNNSQPMIVLGFRNALQVASQTFTGNSGANSVSVNLNADFDYVDEVRIITNDANFTYSTINNIVIVDGVAPANTAPVIASTTAGQAVNDNATITPFSGITITDTDGNNLTATITLDDNTKGVITGADGGSGPYTMSSKTPAAMQTALRALSFNPTDNRAAITETTTFTVLIDDGSADDTDNTTTVISSAVAPTLSSSTPIDGGANVATGANLTLVFSENISLGTGNIQIIDLDDGSGTITINAASSGGQATVSTNTLTLNPTSDLEKSTSYAIQVASTAVVDAGGKSFTGISDNTTLIFTTEAPSSLLVAATVFLEGAFNGTSLDKNINGSIPLNQPYSINGHTGGAASSIPANAVDWILVELREAASAATALNSTKVGSTAGFLMSDGTIKATNGTSNLAVNLTGNSGTDYFVVIYHRNHLSIMSASAVVGSSGTLTIDFTNNSAHTHQTTTALSALGGGKFGMIAGDADGDGDVDATDLTTWRRQNGGGFIYNTTNGDFNLDGVINAVDRNAFQQKNTSKTSQVPDT